MSGIPLVMTGAQIKLYLNNKFYKQVQAVSLVIDYGETERYGIDSPWPQEIAGTKVSVRGSVTGLRIKLSGGLQGSNLRPLFSDMAASPYISIRIQDRSTGEDIVFIPKAKVTKENHTVPAKGSYKLNFDFAGVIPLMALDRS